MEAFMLLMFLILVACAVVSFVYIFKAAHVRRPGWAVIFALNTIFEIYLAWTAWKS